MVTKSKHKERSEEQAAPLTVEAAPSSIKAAKVEMKSVKATKSVAAASKKDEKTSKKNSKDKKDKKDKSKKIKMVRDSFNMPESDYALIGQLKKQCLSAGEHVKKSELLRAGLIALSVMSKPDLLKAVGLVEKVKTGRPAKT
ncbi:MAG: hypothetical protein AB1810_12350 [Pseudomonadota bacterium]